MNQAAEKGGKKGTGIMMNTGSASSFEGRPPFPGDF
jgi:hypothetical protein